MVLFALLGCEDETRYISPDLCVAEGGEFKPIHITDEEVQHFNDHLKLANAGHYLTGAFASSSNEMVYTSVYTGNKRDSILAAEAPPTVQKNVFGGELYWFLNGERLFFETPSGLVIIDFPESVSTEIIPIDGTSKFFQLCD
jgi:hypothetical protein